MGRVGGLGEVVGWLEWVGWGRWVGGVGGVVNAWPVLGQALTVRHGEALNASISHYRNNHQHGQPRAIAMGHVAAVKGVPSKENSWSLGHYEPLSIDTLIAPLVEEHRLSLVAFRAFLTLIEEQHEAELGPKSVAAEG